MFGLGLGLAILIDVLIVRMVIAPAVVTLLGDRAWWLPGWLDRVLPRVTLEGREAVAAGGAVERPAEEEPEREKVLA
jgi:RND superfamily putative drug exporter